MTTQQLTPRQLEGRIERQRTVVQNLIHRLVTCSLDDFFTVRQSLLEAQRELHNLTEMRR